MGKIWKPCSKLSEFTFKSGEYITAIEYSPGLVLSYVKLTTNRGGVATLGEVHEGGHTLRHDFR